LWTAQAGRGAFTHDLLADYFLAEHLLFEHANTTLLAKAVEAPWCASAVPLVIEGLTTESEMASLLSLSEAARRMIPEILIGHHGELAGRVVLGLAKKSIDACVADLDRKTARLNDRPRRAVFDQVSTVTPLEHCLVAAAGASAFSPPIHALARRIPLSCDALISRACSASLNNEDRFRLREEVIDALFGYGGYGWSLTHAFFESLRRSHRLRSPAVSQLAQAWLDDVVANESAGAISLMVACIVADRMLGACTQEKLAVGPAAQVIRLIGLCWSSGSNRVQAEALELAASSARLLPEGSRSELLTFLRDLPSPKNPIVGTALIEALDAFGDITWQESSKDVTGRIESILASPMDSAARLAAWTVFTDQFESLSVISNPCFEAIEELDGPTAARFHAMAALGCERDSLFLVPCLRRMLRGPRASQCDELVREALYRWARPPAPETFFSHEAIEAFALTNAGLAWFGLAPFTGTGPFRPEEEAWQLAGLLIYQAQLRGPEGESSCIQTSWDRLEAALLVEATPILIGLSFVNSSSYRRSEQPKLLHDVWPERLLSLLRRYLVRRDQLDRLGHEASRWVPGLQSVASAVLSMIGALGTDEDRASLLDLLNDPQLASSAMRAIQDIEKRCAPIGHNG
jgi:hypothetical protein